MEDFIAKSVKSGSDSAKLALLAATLEDVKYVLPLYSRLLGPNTIIEKYQVLHLHRILRVKTKIKSKLKRQYRA